MLSKEEMEKILDVNEEIITYKADKDFRCLTSTEKALLENNNKIKQYIKQLETKTKDLENIKDMKKAIELANMSIIDFVYFKYKNEQLESNNKKLIEKLEEEHIKAKTKYSNTLSPYQYGRLDVIEEILKIAKGEKE